MTVGPTTEAAGGAVPSSAPLLAVEGLRVTFPTRRGNVCAVNDVSFSIAEGETLAIVGESGSGKSVSSMAILDLVPAPGQRVGGTIRWRGREMQPADLQKLRGTEIAMIFQDPLATLNPLMPVGRQISEVLRTHRGMSKREAEAASVELLELTGIPLAKKRAQQFPFEFSGGMAQRAMIAIALAAEPALLIADEPTSALDVTIQAQILELIAEVQSRLGIAVILISHDLGVVAATCDRVAVMYAGQVMEHGPVRSVLLEPSHPYTAGLLASTPRLDLPRGLLCSIKGAPPELTVALDACPFAPRCDRASDQCRSYRPPSVRRGDSASACWHPITATSEGA